MHRLLCSTSSVCSSMTSAHSNVCEASCARFLRQTAAACVIDSSSRFLKLTVWRKCVAVRCRVPVSSATEG